MKTHSGSCHCGAVRFEVDSDLDSPFRCNCSFCIRRGAVLQKVPAERFRLREGESALGRYGARDFSDHFFCKTCGIHCFTRLRRADEAAVVVSLGCLDGVDPLSLTPRIFDGATLL